MGVLRRLIDTGLDWTGLEWRCARQEEYVFRAEKEAHVLDIHSGW